MKRRTFVKTIGGAAGIAAFGLENLLWADEALEKVAGMPRRTLGRTGQKLSIVGFPGLAFVHYDQEKCTEWTRKAYERGINYYDVAPAYGNGECENKMGVALQDLPRDKYFLACKTKKRDAAGAMAELEKSLKSLKTDHFDLYQIHHLSKPAQAREALGAGGAMEAILKAKEQGKLRWIGFSAHTTKAALEAMKQFKFDSVMFPINFVEYYTRGFGKEVLALANEQGAGVISIKPLSWGTWPKEGTRNREWWYRSVEEAAQIELAVRFALSQKNVAACIPTSFLELLDRTMTAATKYAPLDDAATAKLKEMAASQGSIFEREEREAALVTSSGWNPSYPDSPHRQLS